MRLNAAASAAINPAVQAPPRPAELLGVTDMALYLRVSDGSAGTHASGDTVIAVMTTDAVRLPCGLLLGFSSAERSLRRIGPLPADPVMVGNGCVQWNSRAGLIVIHAVRGWTPPSVPFAAPGWPAGLAQLRATIDGIDIGVDARLGAELAAAVGDAIVEARAVLAFLGRGPGLTPSGDDVLAGVVLGARAFRVDIGGIATAIEAYAGSRTTALSAQLLHSALAGQSVREVAAVIAALTDASALGPALRELLRVGHTSGAALAHGLVIAAQLALTPAGGGR